METREREEEHTISVEEFRKRMASDPQLVVLDVREYPEYTEAHVEGSRLVPLPELRRDPALAGEAGEVFLLCRTGRRAREAATILRDKEGCRPVVVEGGLDAWQQSGHPVRQQKGPISLERQVRIAAGTLVLAGLLIPGLGFLSYVVGAGLVFAGVTNSCAMGLLLARLPWNRRKPTTSGAR